MFKKLIKHKLSKSLEIKIKYHASLPSIKIKEQEFKYFLRRKKMLKNFKYAKV
jgi:hypothetical protein